MADRTAINYVDASWSPVAGCTPISAGCAHCFAARYAKRKIGAFACDERDDYAGVTSHPFSEVQCREDQLTVPLGWRKPRTILVPTLGDLFHPDVPDDFIDRMFAVMALCPQHRFLQLTKRPERMQQYLASLGRSFARLKVAVPVGWALEWAGLPLVPWPLPNLWCGVSCEDQATADERIPILLQTPAAHRWISYEPAIAPIVIPSVWLRRLSLLVVGGETGPGARVCRAEWIADVIEQCRAAKVPVWVKQLGAAFDRDPMYDKRKLLVRERPW